MTPDLGILVRCLWPDFGGAWPLVAAWFAGVIVLGTLLAWLADRAEPYVRAYWVGPVMIVTALAGGALVLQALGGQIAACPATVSAVADPGPAPPPVEEK